MIRLDRDDPAQCRRAFKCVVTEGRIGGCYQQGILKQDKRAFLCEEVVNSLRQIDNFKPALIIGGIGRKRHYHRLRYCVVRGVHDVNRYLGTLRGHISIRLVDRCGVFIKIIAASRIVGIVAGMHGAVTNAA